MKSKVPWLVCLLSGVVLAVESLLITRPTYATPSAADGCVIPTVSSFQGPESLPTGAAADYFVTITNTAPRAAPGAPDICDRGVLIGVTTTSSLQLSKPTTGSALTCVRNAPLIEPSPALAAVFNDPGYDLCVAQSLRSGDRITLTIGARAGNPGESDLSVYTVHGTQLKDADGVGYQREARRIMVNGDPQGAAERRLPIVSIGADGETTMTLQYLLRHHGQDVEVDGDFGPQTDGAVRAFQQGRPGLVVDGIVGPQTWPALFVTVKKGSQGDAVMAVQSQLAARGVDIEVDGDFGPQTEAAVLAFQQGHPGTVADGAGVVGPRTWQALLASD